MEVMEVRIKHKRKPPGRARSFSAALSLTIDEKTLVAFRSAKVRHRNPKRQRGLQPNWIRFPR